jgi:nucleoside-diphosphate-sugar epimerase
MEKSGILTMQMLILGAGFSGKAIGALAARTFERVWGTTRNVSRFPALEALGISPLVFDGATISGELHAMLGEVTHLVQSISPDEDGDGFLKICPSLKALMPKLQWVGYLSTIGIYGNHNGAWVDETVAPTPLSARSRERVVAEDQWLAAGERENIPVAILRLSGIYGPGRNAFVNLENGTARRLIKKDQVFSRIRVEDIAGATLFLLQRGLGGAFNVTDHCPAPAQDIIEYAAGLMGVPVPPDIPFETAELSPMARSFYGENKRVRNDKICNLGFAFAYPDYQMSLRQMWADGNWHG